MHGKLRGIFIAHTDFQGNTPQAVLNAKQFADTIMQALKSDFEAEVDAAQKANRLEATLDAAELYAQFEENYKIKVVKIELAP